MSNAVQSVAVEKNLNKLLVSIAGGYVSSIGSQGRYINIYTSSTVLQALLDKCSSILTDSLQRLLAHDIGHGIPVREAPFSLAMLHCR